MLRPSFRFRLIPATLGIAALALTLRLTGLWTELQAASAGTVIGTAIAEEPRLGTPEPAQAAAPEGSIGTRPAPAAAATAAAIGKLLPGDTVPLTATEIELLQKLAERREALDARERELDLREGLVRAAEKRLQEQTDELAALQARIEALVAKHDEAQEQKLAGLVSIYEKMKPKDAARIMNELDMDILVEVLGRMRDTKTAPVLANMDAERARAVTARLAERQVLLGAKH